MKNRTIILQQTAGSYWRAIAQILQTTDFLIEIDEDEDNNALLRESDVLGSCEPQATSSCSNTVFLATGSVQNGSDSLHENSDFLQIHESCKIFRGRH